MESTLGDTMKDAATMLNAVAAQLTLHGEGRVRYDREAYLAMVAQLGKVLHKMGEEVDLAILSS